MHRPADHHATLVAALLNPAAWPHPVDRVECIETHISSVLLVGDYAYKLKKPVDLGFLDFSTLAQRRFYCEEEVRLNRRTAPDVYLAAVPVFGSADSPTWVGDGEPIDWLVQMRRFDAHAVLAEHLPWIDAPLIDELARRIADFHRQAEPATTDSPYGTPDLAYKPMAENFEQVRQHIDTAEILAHLEPLETWTEKQFARLRSLMAERRGQGHVRECHGDLHLGNIALQQGKPLIFDGIEFSPELRWIDTISDLAFLLMDLSHGDRAGLANRLLNRYLELTGDYPALPLLDIYLTYRAMVRAKVTAIRAGQPGLDPSLRRQLLAQCVSYLELAKSFTKTGRGGLIITHGVSGSGKTTRSDSLLQRMPVVRIRSDVERKRMAGMTAAERGGAELYGADITVRTYDRLAELAGIIIESGRIALVDATFLLREQRRQFIELANRFGVPVLILSFEAPVEALRQRVTQRHIAGSDASDAGVEVLMQQLETCEPLDEEERSISLSVPDSDERLLIEVAEAMHVY